MAKTRGKQLVQASSPPLPRHPSSIWIGPSDLELGWLFSQVSRVTPTISLDQPDHWKAFSHQLDPTHVWIASRTRTDEVIESYERIGKQWPNAKVGVLLGAWWPGQRRCQPLPEMLESFYWYEWWDRILPWMGLAEDADTHGPAFRKPESMVPATRLARILAMSSLWVKPRPMQVLVTSADGTAEDMWGSLFSAMDMPVCFRRVEEPLPRSAWDIHVVDAASWLGEIPADEYRTFLQRSRLPGTKCLVRTAFPSWEEWQNWLAAGADWIVGSPFQISGLAQLLAA